MEIKLNIYKGKKIEKTHTVDGYDLMFGTVEDFVNIIDIDKLDDTKALAVMIVKGFSQLKPLFLDIFPELTEEELKRTKVLDLVDTIMQIGQAIGESFAYLGNQMRG